MSRTLSRSTCALLASAAAAFGLTQSAVASPSPTVTSNTTAQYRCLFPIAGVQPVSIDWTVRALQQMRPGDLVVYEAKATAGGESARLPRLTQMARLDGVLDAGMDLAVTDGTTRRFAVPFGAVTFATPSAEATLDFTASVQAPLEFDELGSAKINSATLRFNLAGRDAAGAPVLVRQLTTDLDGNPVIDSDQRPDTFDVYCKADPAPVALTNTLFLNGPGAPDVTPPSAPTEVDPQATDLTPTSVNLRWGASTDEVGGSGLKEYVIRYEDGPAEGLRVPAGTTSKLITGLSQETDYTFLVTAVDYAGNESAELVLPVGTFHFDPCWVFSSCPAPLAPIAPAAVAVTQTSARIQWTAPKDENIAGYRVDVVGLLAPPLESSAETRVDLTGLKPGTVYTAKVTSISKDTTAPPSEPASVTFTTLTPERLDPPLEGDYTWADIGATFVTVRWKHALTNPGGAGLREYVVETSEGETYTVPATTTFKRIDGLSSDSEYLFSVYAVDESGNRSEALTQLLFPVCGTPCGGGLLRPTGLRAVDVGVNTVDLAWNKSSDPDVPDVKYDVYSGTVKLGTTSATTFRVSGLNSDTAYTFRVQAVDIDGRTSDFSDDLRVTTRKPVPETRRYSYAVTGTTVLKTLAKGSLPLKGGVEADLGSVSGAFSADLTLANTSGRLIAGGFLPLTAKVGFAPSGKTTGQLTGGVLQTNSWVRIKVLEVKLFGAIPLAGGNSCQTRQLSDIALTSGAAFNPAAGGTLNGTFKISDLNGCGVLNGLVSPLTAGAGNTISLNLAPKVA